MKENGYWELFQVTGQIEDYLQYRQQYTAGEDAPKENVDANYNDGTGIARDED